MNRPAGGSQPLRTMAGNVYPSQANANRNTPLASQRAQNGKLGSGTGWPFGMPVGGGAPGLSNPRTPLSNFAQAIGGSQSQAPLDLSEFPSLGPQPQQPSSVPQAWNSTALRQAQQPPAQRPQPAQQPQQRSVSGQTTSSQHHELPSIDAQYDGQSAGSTRGTGEQSQDEFPPLGGQMNGDPRRVQGAINGLIGQLNGQVDRGIDAQSGDGTFGAGAGSADVIRSPSDLIQDVQASAPRQSRGPSNPPGIDHQLPFREGAFASSLQQAPIGQPGAAQQAHQGANFAPQLSDPPVSSQPLHLKPLSEMTEDEKWGLPGLLAKLPGRGEDASSLLMGQDLNTLGLNLESREPLFPTFATPFDDQRSRPIVPDFTLPVAYGVNNVPPLHSRITAMSDDTLFMIFYQYPRDVLQEIAAGELYSRDWRWHKELQQWMMKDGQMAAPIRVSERSERGVYIFFDANNWRRERREFVLNYDHLDQRHGSTQPPPSL